MVNKFETKWKSSFVHRVLPYLESLYDFYILAISTVCFCGFEAQFMANTLAMSLAADNNRR